MKSLESETNTTILLPKHGNDGDMTITGVELQQVTEATVRIHSLANEIRDSYSAMQFISIPVLSDEIKDNFEKFKVAVTVT